MERLEQAIAHAGRGSLAAIPCLDLDHFNDINDTLGHAVADSLLRAVGDRPSACVRQVDKVSHFGGDQFAVMQADAERVEDVGLLARRIIEMLSLPYQLDGHQVVVGASIGIALIPADGADPDKLLKNGDIALYRAKSDGRGVFRFFAPAMDTRLQERRRLELDLQHAMTHHEFELFYQKAAGAPGGRPHLRLRGAAALAPSHARPAGTEPVRAADGGNGADRAARRVGAAGGVPRGGRAGRTT